MTIDEDTILAVVKNGLCTGCGTCVAICPASAIKLISDETRGAYVPMLTERCIHCGLCVKTCPGRQVDFNALNKDIFGRSPKNILLGNYIRTYVGYAVDRRIRVSSSSGGLVTEMLCYLLETERIDGALVVKTTRDRPLKPEPFVATSKEEIVDAMGSKYCPVPANLGLKDVLRSKCRRLAVVGLPCQIHGLRKGETNLERLAEMVYLHIGIFCGNTPSFYATKYILNKLGLRESEIESLSYRGHGWPGYLKITLKDRSDSIQLPFFSYWDSGFGQFFCNMRCRLCIDQTNELADVSVGDAWIPELMDQKNSISSLIISRSLLSEEILEEMKDKGLVKLIGINAEKAVQEANIFKKAGYKLWASSAKSYKVPKYNADILNPTLKMISYYLIFKTGSFLAHYPELWTMLDAYAKLFNYCKGLLISMKSIALGMTTKILRLK